MKSKYTLLYTTETQDMPGISSLYQEPTIGDDFRDPVSRCNEKATSQSLALWSVLLFLYLTMRVAWAESTLTVTLIIVLEWDTEQPV